MKKISDEESSLRGTFLVKLMIMIGEIDLLH